MFALLGVGAIAVGVSAVYIKAMSKFMSDD